MVPPSARHILISGAGIGGLTLACALHRAGLRATVLESADALRQVGAGLIVQMNASLALRRIGLCDAVVAEGARPEQTVVLDAKRARLTRVDVGVRTRPSVNAPFGHDSTFHRESPGLTPNGPFGPDSLSGLPGTEVPGRGRGCKDTS
ncbi:MAG: hypothetical protein EOO71_03655 [Myxococcaceae bacterium]|nr:MAG: hypothetical protein EOO71_03655 [Myxococcaceae bacterium]